MQLDPRWGRGESTQEEGVAGSVLGHLPSSIRVSIPAFLLFLPGKLPWPPSGPWMLPNLSVFRKGRNEDHLVTGVAGYIVPGPWCGAVRGRLSTWGHGPIKAPERWRDGGGGR